jgi:hypothetical protein
VQNAQSVPYNFIILLVDAIGAQVTMAGSCEAKVFIVFAGPKQFAAPNALMPGRFNFRS